MSLLNNLGKILSRREEIEKLLSSGEIESTKLMKLSKELSEIKPISDQAEIVKSLEKNLFETQEILNDDNNEMELIQLATNEISEINNQLKLETEKLKLFLIPKSKDDKKNVILEIL